MGWKFSEIICSKEFTREEKLSIIQDLRNNIQYITFEDIVIMFSIPVILEIIRGYKR